MNLFVTGASGFLGAHTIVQQPPILEAVSAIFKRSSRGGATAHQAWVHDRETR